MCLHLLAFALTQGEANGVVLALPLKLAEDKTLELTPGLTLGFTLGLAKGGTEGELLELTLGLKEGEVEEKGDYLAL